MTSPADIANAPELSSVSFEGLPEFDARDAPEKAKWAIALGYVLHPGERARADILRRWLPGVKIEADDDGRLVASYRGERGYVNKPGASMQDFLTLAAETVKFLPSAKFASMGANATTQIVRGVTSAAATKAASDVGAATMGSKQGVDAPGVVMTGAAAGAAQAATPYIARGTGWLTQKGVDLWRRMRGAGLVQPGQPLTSRAAAIAREAGLDPDEITPQLAARLESAAREALDSDLTGLTGDQLRSAVRNKALGDRFGVPMTKGELTGDYAQQSLEENLAKMDVSTRAGRTMRTAREESARTLAGADGSTGAGLLRAEIAPRAGGIADQVEAGQAVVDATKWAGRIAETSYQGAYEDARAAGAAVRGQSYRGFLQSAQEAVRNAPDFDYDAALMPKTAAMLENLAKRETWFQEVPGATQRHIPLAKVESLRKTVNAVWQSADATDRLGLTALRRRLDDWIMAGLDDGSIVGDKGAVEMWKRARTLFGNYKQTYGPGNAASGTPERAAGDTIERWLASDHTKGADAARVVLNSPALVRRLVGIFGKDSDVHQAIKFAELDNVLGPAIKNGQLSPQLAASRIDRFFFGKDREVAQAIYSKAEIAAVREFRQLLQAKIPQDGVVNYSNAGNVLAKLFQQHGLMAGFAAGPKGAAVVVGLNAAQRTGRAAQASRAVAGLSPAHGVVTPATAAAIANSVTSD